MDGWTLKGVGIGDICIDFSNGPKKTPVLLKKMVQVILRTGITVKHIIPHLHIQYRFLYGLIELR